MIFIQCKSAAIKLIIKRISRVFWFCYGSKLQKYQAPVAIKTQCRTKLLAFRLELKWRVWAERQSLALNYEFEWTERQTQLLLTSSVLKKKGFDWGMCKKGGRGGRGGKAKKNAKKQTEVISKHELRLSTNLHPKQERGSWMTISHSPIIIRSSQAWWPEFFKFIIIIIDGVDTDSTSKMYSRGYFGGRGVEVVRMSVRD